MRPLRVSLGLEPQANVIKADEYRLLVAAREIIDVASAHADRIVGEADAAYQAECDRGYAEGLANARLEEAEKMMENVSRTIDYFARVEADAVELVMSAVRKIFADFKDEEKVAIVVRGALAAVRSQKTITLRLHPDQVSVVKERINDILSGFPAIGFVDVVGDGRLEPHACIVETEIGLVETSLDGQLSALRKAFQRVLGEQHPEHQTEHPDRHQGRQR